MLPCFSLPIPLLVFGQLQFATLPSVLCPLPRGPHTLRHATSPFPLPPPPSHPSPPSPHQPTPLPLCLPADALYNDQLRVSRARASHLVTRPPFTPSARQVRQEKVGLGRCLITAPAMPAPSPCSCVQGRYGLRGWMGGGEGGRATGKGLSEPCGCVDGRLGSCSLVPQTWLEEATPLRPASPVHQHLAAQCLGCHRSHRAVQCIVEDGCWE